MNHFLTMFFAPECGAMQATMTSPPANKLPARRRWGRIRASVRFLAGIVANAAGFGLLLAGCWFSLQLMQALLL